MEDLSILLDLAEHVSRAAGDQLLAGNDSFRKINAEEGKDVKLQADTESEKLIRAILSNASSLPIIGEEEGGSISLPESEQLYWVVDPLDGTYNYLKDLPMACVSIGLFRGHSPVLGVVFDFYRNELFKSIVGQGLYLNGVIFQPCWSKSIEKAAIATGFPSDRDYSSPSLQRFVEEAQRFKKVRLLGSAALALAYVATGRVDAYHEENIRLWDVAAGLALVKAAGGVIRMTPANNLPFTYDVWASGRAEFILS